MLAPEVGGNPEVRVAALENLREDWLTSISSKVSRLLFHFVQLHEALNRNADIATRNADIATRKRSASKCRRKTGPFALEGHGTTESLRGSAECRVLTRIQPHGRFTASLFEP